MLSMDDSTYSRFKKRFWVLESPEKISELFSKQAWKPVFKFLYCNLLAIRLGFLIPAKNGILDSAITN